MLFPFLGLSVLLSIRSLYMYIAFPPSLELPLVRISALLDLSTSIYLVITVGIP